MLNKDFYLKEAEKFQGEGDCFIHIEMKNGKHCERLCGGDIVAILHGTVGLIDNLARYTNSTFADVLKDIRGYKKAMDKQGGFDGGRKDNN